MSKPKKEKHPWPAAIQKKLKKLPGSPGVYQFFDAEGELLYIGKAKVLKNRVRSYFQKSIHHAPKTKKMLSKIADLEMIETKTEVEALLLEKNLVQKYLPPFNVLLRDDKHFLYVEITKEPFPNVSFARQRDTKKAKYFGPYVSAKNIRRLVDFAREVLQFKMCKVSMDEQGDVVSNPEKRKIPCLDAQMHHCVAPCTGVLSTKDYQEKIHLLEDFLRGKRKTMQALAKKEMEEAAIAKNFERAARFRDIWQSMEQVGQMQSVTIPQDISAHVFGFFYGVEKSFAYVFSLLEGRVISANDFSLETGFSAEETFLAFFRDYLDTITEIPPLFCVPEIFPEEERVSYESYLTELSGRRVELRTPQRGDMKDLLQLAEKNATRIAANSAASFEKDDSLERLQAALGMEKLPKTMECYDISHLGGTHVVASRVVFVDGKPDKNQYRRYKIKSLTEGKSDDFASMAEVLDRRLARIEEKKRDIMWEERTLPLSSKGELEGDFSEESGALKGEKDLKSPPGPLFAKEGEVVCKEKGKEIGSLKTQKHKTFLELLKVHAEEGHNAEEILALFLQQENLKTLRMLVPEKKELRWQVSLEHLGFTQEKKPPKALQECTKKEQLICWKYDPKKIKKKEEMPDLIVIDGGKGQLSAAHAVLKKYQLEEKINLCSLAKKQEEIFITGQSQPLPILKESKENKLLQAIRNEAHRFAITYNKKLRSKAEITSALDEVLGLSESKKMELLKVFGSVEGIKKASKEELGKYLSARVVKSLQEML